MKKLALLIFGTTMLVGCSDTEQRPTPTPVVINQAPPCLPPNKAEAVSKSEQDVIAAALRLVQKKNEGSELDEQKKGISCPANPEQCALKEQLEQRGSELYEEERLAEGELKAAIKRLAHQHGMQVRGYY